MNEWIVAIATVACAFGYISLVWYLLINSKPLGGEGRKVFLVSAGPIFIVLLILNIHLSFQLVPQVMETLSAHKGGSSRGNAILGLLFSTPLPVFGLLFLHRILAAIRPGTGDGDCYLPPICVEQLTPEKVEIPYHKVGVTEAIVFRKKELRAPPGYFFIVLNGVVVAALNSHEYTMLVHWIDLRIRLGVTPWLLWA
jgi:hypothetical protein